MTEVTLELRVTSIRSRGKRGGVIFSAVGDSGDSSIVVCDYSLIPDPAVVTKGQVWYVKGSLQRFSYQRNGYPITEEQILASAVSLQKPSGHNLVAWIANSDECVGIGHAKAAKLFSRFGDSLVRYIEERNSLISRDLLSEEQAEALFSAFEGNGIARTLLWLDRVGFPRRLGRKVTEYFGDAAKEKIEDNPYVLMSFCASWEFVDQIAVSRFHVQLQDERRLSAALENVLYDAYKDGHTCLPRRATCERLAHLLESRQLANQALELALVGSVRVLGNGDYQAEGAALIESFLASRLQEIVAGELVEGQQSLLATSVVETVAIDSAIANFERELSWPLGAEQRSAVHTCVNSNLSLILGGAGTGKTTVLRCLYEVLEATRDGVVIYQMALAGRAAQRMTEATSRPSMTIAAFLARVQSGDLSGDSVIVVDETSMVDVILAYRLLNHLPAGVKLILVGDPSQLAPIGPGLVLHALVGQSSIPQITLTQVRRQSGASGIPAVAEAVRRHEPPIFSSYQGKGTGVSFIECPDSKLEEAVVHIYEELGGRGADFSVQVLAITVNSLGSVNVLNRALHQKYRSEAPQLHYFDLQYGVVGATTQDKLPIKVGDLIIYCKSDEELQLRNGSLGRVVEALPAVDEDSEICICDFEGFERRLKAPHLDHVKHAYAITIHKSQGSQFSRVIIPVRKSRLLDQSLIYTAITRSVDQVVLVGDLGAAINAIKSPSKAARRHINLSALLDQRVRGHQTAEKPIRPWP